MDEAMRRAELLAQVWGRHAEGVSLRRSVAEVAPEWTWSQFQHLRRRYEHGEGPAWERMLDRRVPPPQKPVPDPVRHATCGLRMAVPAMGCDQARQLLIAKFGEAGDISDSSLKRIWGRAGLVGRAGNPAGVGAETVTYSGGAGIALLAAAEAETGSFAALAEAAMESGRRTIETTPDPDEPFEPSLGPRDDRGRFVPEYNIHYRDGVAEDEADSRWDGDASKRNRRPLASLQLVKLGPKWVQKRLFAMGAAPLLTERRGFGGLNAPPGAWLGVALPTAYRGATLDKALSELALLDVGEAMWNCHANLWHRISTPWRQDGPSWLQFAVYIDATQDPYWTSRFALSGKVSRTGRVSPCLSRIVVTGGPGVPLVVETVAGTVSLKRRLPLLLDELDRVLGPGEVGRLSIIDAEMATVEILDALTLSQQRGFVTVVKGGALKSARVTPRGPWVSYRKHDEVRETDIVLSRSTLEDHDITLRAVQMQRPGSRNPVTTHFVTDMPPEALPTEDVASAYLSRWPHQEQLHRNARNGGGLNRSHGFGGQNVAHVALETKLEKLERSVAAAERDLERVGRAAEDAEKSDSLSSDTRKVVGTARRKAEKRLQNSRRELERYQSHPREIYKRDTTRETVMTCVKMAMLALVEFALHEYFGGLKIQYRTFIEELNMLPVTVVTSPSQVTYRIHPNERQPARMDRLRKACDAINERDLHQAEKRLRFELLDKPALGRDP